MPLDPDTLRLAEYLIASAKTCAFGTLVVDVTTRYLVPVRNGRVMGSTVKEILPHITIEQLKAEQESVIT